MTATATVLIPADEFVIGAILQDAGEAEIELLPLVPIEKNYVPYLRVDAADPAAFEATVRADPRTSALQRIGSDGPGSLYRIEWDPEVDAFLGGVFDHGLIVERGYTVHSSWCFEFRAPDTEEFARFHRRCNERDISIDVRRVRSDGPASDERSRVTGKQRQAMELAFDRGYFSVPRETTLSELGEAVGISRQAFSRRLRRGTYNLLVETWFADRSR
jgi:predicted DNA binding protein